MTSPIVRTKLDRPSLGPILVSSCYSVHIRNLEMLSLKAQRQRKGCSRYRSRRSERFRRLRARREEVGWE